MAYYYWELQAFDLTARTCHDVQQRATRLRRAWMSRRASGLLVRSLARQGGYDDTFHDEIRQEIGRLGEMVPREVAAEVLLAEKKPEEALREAIALTDEARSSGSTARLLVSIELHAHALLDLRCFGETISLLQEGCSLAEDCKALSMSWRLLALRGEAEEGLGDDKGAMRSFRQASAILRQIGDAIADTQDRTRFFASPLAASVLGASD